MSRNRRSLRSGRRGTVSAANFLLGLAKVLLPLGIVGAAAYFVLMYRADRPGYVRVVTSVPGAEILVDGSQTGYSSDTTVPITPGRRIITVRKLRFVSDPEFVVVELNRGTPMAVRFDLRLADTAVRSDSISPLRPVRQEIFSTGQPVRSIPPAYGRSDRHLVDFSGGVPETHSEFSAPAATTPVVSQVSPGIVRQEASLPFVTETGPLSSTQITVSSTPDGADISVNGSPSSHKTPYAFRGLDRGVYQFTARMDGYVTKPESVMVSLTNDFQSELIAFELTPDPSAPKPALVVSTEPLAAGFRVNGRPSGMGKATLEPGFGTARIDFADVPGYKTPDPVTVTLSADNPNVEVTGRYERLIGNAYLAVLPSEEIEKFDGKLLRIYVDNELILDSPAQKFNATLLGKILEGRRLIRVQYGDLSADTYVELSDASVSELSFRIESFFSKRKLRLRERDTIPLEQWQQRSKRLTVLAGT